MGSRIIVVLCGSTRFPEAFAEANLRLTLAGKIVLSIGANMRDDDVFVGMPAEEVARIKRDLDDLHLDKIDYGHEIEVQNVGGYIGNSTLREIAYAWATKKRVYYREPDNVEPVERMIRGLRLAQINAQTIRALDAEGFTRAFATA